MKPLRKKAFSSFLLKFHKESYIMYKSTAILLAKSAVLMSLRQFAAQALYHPVKKKRR